MMLIAWAQWSRPACLLIVGVRPNSPNIITSVSSQHAALGQVVEQGADGLIDDRQVLAQPLEVVGVRVPADRLVDGDEAHARLDQPPGQQQPLAELVAAVAVAQLVRLLVDVEGPVASRGDRMIWWASW